MLEGASAPAQVLVLGAGAWGTAIACALASRHRVTLWGRDAAAVQAMQRDRVNARYLPGVSLPATLQLSSQFDAAVAAVLAAAGPRLVLLATPTAALRATLAQLAAIDVERRLPLVWLCKGFERAGHHLAHEIVAEAWGVGTEAGPLSGPSFADEVARGLPTALVVAGPPALCDVATAVCHGGALRIYASDDVIGVEIGGAVKNVLAIATGIADALGLGMNARAALITRGLAETTRLGVALGARAETFMGLTGLGDLILTATGDLSRNRKVGLLLGQGVQLADALAQLGHVAEGVGSAPAVLARARALGVDMPLAQAVAAVLAAKLEPAEALRQLLARGPKRETLQ